MKRVLAVGNCVPDYGSLRTLIEQHFEVEVDAADGLDGALQAIEARTYQLILVNRLMDRDGSSGMDAIRQIASRHAIPVMLLSNYPEYQQEAETLGAVMGFGKAQINDPVVVDRLRPYLG